MKKLKPLILLILFPVFLIGCDGLGDNNAELNNLKGSWKTTDLIIDETSAIEQVEVDYDKLIFTLREDNNGRKRFNVIGSERENEEKLFVQGNLGVDKGELRFQPKSSSNFEVNYSLVGNNELVLTAEKGRSENLILDMIDLFIQGNFEKTQVVLTKK